MSMGAQSVRSLVDLPSERLDKFIKLSLERVSASKETDLCRYLYKNGRSLSPSAYLEMKDMQKEELASLLQGCILEEKPQLQALSPEDCSLEEFIEEAMMRTQVDKETSLCRYIPQGESHLHHVSYLKIKRDEPQRLKYLIKQNILDKKPEEIESGSICSNPSGPLNKSLEGVIIKALTKLADEIEGEDELCRYIPHKDSFLHPLAYRSLKYKNAKKLASLIKEHILTVESPERRPWVTSTCKGKKFESKRKLSAKECFEETPAEKSSKIDQLVEMMDKLAAKIERSQPEKAPSENKQVFIARSRYNASYRKNLLQVIQNQLIASVERGEIDHELWGCYASLNSAHSF